MLLAILVFLSFDRTGSRAVKEGLCKRNLEKEKENITETELEKMEEENKEEENGTYAKPVDYGASQELVDSFATRLGLNPEGQKEGKYNNNNGEDGVRRCDRLMDKKNVKTEELAKQRAVDNNNYGKLYNLDEGNSSFLFHG